MYVLLIIATLGAFVAAMLIIRSVDRSFASQIAGISFNYPQTVKIFDTSEFVETTPYRVVIKDTSDVNLGTLGGNKTSPEILIEIYNKNSNISTEQWLTVNREHTWSLSKEGFTKTKINNYNAIIFDWSGTYAGKAVAIDNGKKIAVIRVEYATKDDGMLEAWNKIASSFKFTK